MKKFWALIFLMFLFLPILRVSADPIPVFPKNQHIFNKCVRITNLKDFPDIVLITIAHTRSNLNPTPSDKPSESLFWSVRPILSDKCLSDTVRSYSDLYWTTKERFKKIDLKHIALDRKLFNLGDQNGDKKNDYVFEYYPKDFTFLATFKDLGRNWSNYVDNSDSRIGEIIDYRLYSNPDGSLSLIKSGTRDIYNEKEMPQFETFRTSFKDKLKGIFNWIIYSFLKRFSKNPYERFH